ncbi:hypothetical protein AX16_002475 [Volvariella volvacea WC 439]|nr:hypothetical protein AX16_002475 [Volvariella volvacea WC 439]
MFHILQCHITVNPLRMLLPNLTLTSDPSSMPGGFHPSSSSAPQEDITSNFKRFQDLLKTRFRFSTSQVQMSSSEQPPKWKRTMMGPWGNESEPPAPCVRAHKSP